MLQELPELEVMDFIGPAIGAVIFIILMNKTPEPRRHKFNAVFVAGAGAAYLNGGLGAWEYLYVIFATALAYKGLDSYKYIGIAWLAHTAWDIVHHIWATPIWPWMATSSIGCAVFDAIIGFWFIASRLESRSPAQIKL